MVQFYSHLTPFGALLGEGLYPPIEEIFGRYRGKIGIPRPVGTMYRIHKNIGFRMQNIVYSMGQGKYILV